MNLSRDGFAIITGGLSIDLLERVTAETFTKLAAGERCLLDLAAVREAAIFLKSRLIKAGFLGDAAVAIQAIAFDKTAAKNWKVPWHQDWVFPFAGRVASAGFDLATVKAGVDYARPPVAILERLLAVRLHLDDCDAMNGPLRISPGSHRDGVIETGEIAGAVARRGETAATAARGEILLMRPLVLHASSQASRPRRRRVLHFVYDSGGALPERWHRAI